MQPQELNPRRRAGSAPIGCTTDLAAITQRFGLHGADVTDLNQFGPLFNTYAAQDRAEVWNIHVSDQVVSPNTRRGNARGHGTV
jgi:hypothetical protein